MAGDREVKPLAEGADTGIDALRHGRSVQETASFRRRLGRNLPNRFSRPGDKPLG
jgi:hypothetical protein